MQLGNFGLGRTGASWPDVLLTRGQQCVLGALLLSLLGCAVGVRDSMSTQTNDTVTQPSLSIDPQLGERLYPGEQALAEEIGEVIERSLRGQFASGAILRDAHPKAHGCVRAEFVVSDTLPDELSHGVFVPGARYQAWIRFSNGSRDATRSDIKGDARGMAI